MSQWLHQSCDDVHVQPQHFNNHRPWLAARLPLTFGHRPWGHITCVQAKAKTCQPSNGCTIHVSMPIHNLKHRHHLLCLPSAHCIPLQPCQLVQDDDCTPPQPCRLVRDYIYKQYDDELAFRIDIMNSSQKRQLHWKARWILWENLVLRFYL